MIKRILAGAAATGFAATLVFGGSASAVTACPNNASQQSAAPHTDTLATNPADGGIVYGKQVGTGGYLGISGPHGYLEASSNKGLGGSNPDTGVSGRITPTGGICIAGTTAH